MLFFETVISIWLSQFGLKGPTLLSMYVKLILKGPQDLKAHLY